MRLTVFSIFLALFLTLTGVMCYAQYPPQVVYRDMPKVSHGYTPSWDGDIRQMRFNVNPSLRYHIDDYTQYAPAVLMLGLKAFGYEGRSGWGRMLVSDAFSGAIMAAAVNSLKYTVCRPRPDGSSNNSFPSGHTAMAFMTAAMLHREYGWRSPWFSIGGYTVAAFTGISRLLNNRHWMSDVAAGAVIGISSVHLGYFLADLIFRERHLSSNFESPDPFGYDPEHRYYDLEFFFSGRLVLGPRSSKDEGSLPFRGGSAGAAFRIPVSPGSGAILRFSSNELSFKGAETARTLNMYNVHAGGYWTWAMPRFVEFDAKILLGYAWNRFGNGLDVLGGVSAALRAGQNFRIRAFAEYETFSFAPQRPYINSFLLGVSSSVCW